MSVIDLIYANITKLENSKEAIRQAIIQMGVDVGVDIPFSLYPEFIRAIELNEVLFVVIDSINNYDDRTYKWVYAKDTKSWYIINDCGDYSEWGEYIVGEAPTCKFKGLLWVQNDGYEWEWNGNNWVVIGVCPEVSCLPDMSVIGYNQAETELAYNILTDLGYGWDEIEDEIAKTKVYYDSWDVNTTTTREMFKGNTTGIVLAPKIDMINVTDAHDMFIDNTTVIFIPDLDMSNCDDFCGGCARCTNLIHLGNITGANIGAGFLDNLNYVILNCSNIEYLGGFTDYNSGKLDISYTTKIDREQIMNVINSIGTTTSVRNSLKIGTTNLAKLSDEDIAIATNKGWVVS